MALTKNDLNMIRKKGIDILAKELGPVSMAYFIQQFDVGYGDYTKERQDMFKDISIDEVIFEIEKMDQKKRVGD